MLKLLHIHRNMETFDGNQLLVHNKFANVNDNTQFPLDLMIDNEFLLCSLSLHLILKMRQKRLKINLFVLKDRPSQLIIGMGFVPLANNNNSIKHGLVE